MITFHAQKNTMDDETVMERASELGMIMPETQISGTETDTEQTEPTTLPDTQPAADSDKKNDGTENSDTKKDDDQKDNVDLKKNEASENNKNSEKKEDSKNESEEITLTIKKGEVCRQLAENLAGLGLVEDAETFRKYMQQCGYDDQIRVGTYHLKRGMTQEEIAKVFVTK